MNVLERYPLVTVAIRTFNSSKVLDRTLRAIRSQTYPQEQIDLLIVDGMSKDETRSMAQRYACRIIDNRAVDLISGAIVCLKNVRGKYLLSIDHDEVLENPNSIMTRIEAMRAHPECRLACPSGYKRPMDYSLLNQYSSDVGDPFSAFMYNGAADHSFFLSFLKRHWSVIMENDEYAIIDFSSSTHQILLEIFCGGMLVDFEYFKALVGGEPFRLITESHAFYRMLLAGSPLVIVAKHDPLVHYSLDSLHAYYAKLRWRIANNIHHSARGGGFSDRLAFQNNIRYKKFFFIPYSMSLVLPLWWGIRHALSRRNLIYLLHPWLCLYVVVNIIWQYMLKILGKCPPDMTYDGTMKLDADQLTKDI